MSDNKPAETRESIQRPAGGIFRAWQDKPELRDGDGEMPTLVTRFAVFDIWAEINSWYEGRFLEKLKLGAFKKTFRENANAIKVLFQHGQDPSIGSKVLGPPDVLREEEDGAWGESPLFDTAYNRDLIPGIKAGQYGSSFRFEVMREDFDERPKRSDHNPNGLPERTIKEVRLFEFGPVTFPAYADATAGLRSGTDRFIFNIIERDPELVRSLLNLDPGQLDPEGDEPAPATADAADSAQPVRTSARARRSTSLFTTQPRERKSWRLS